MNAFKLLFLIYQTVLKNVYLGSTQSGPVKKKKSHHFQNMYFYYVLDLRVLYFALRRMLDHMISRGPSQSELPCNLTTFL